MMTAKQARHSHFQRGTGMYACNCCGRNTRSTGRGDNEGVRLCVECYELAGYDNMRQDGGEFSPADLNTVRAYLLALGKHGINGHDHFPELCDIVGLGVSR